MSWSLRELAIRHVAPFPAGAQVIQFIHGVHRRDLIVVAIASAPGGLPYAVSDNSPGGGNTYAEVDSGTSGSGGHQAALVAAVADHDASIMGVTVALGVGTAALWTICAVLYRHILIPSVDSHGAIAGTATDPGPLMIGVSTPDDILVGWVSAFPGAATYHAIAPLVDVSRENSSLGVTACYSESLSESALSPVGFTGTGTAEWVLIGASFKAVVPPPPRFHTSFLGGGTQPAPVYYKQEGGPILSRPLRRRLRREGFHV